MNTSLSLSADISQTVFSISKVNVATFVCRSSRPTMFKVWSHDRQQKKLVSASSVQELVQKGNILRLRAVLSKETALRTDTDRRMTNVAQ